MAARGGLASCSGTSGLLKARVPVRLRSWNLRSSVPRAFQGDGDGTPGAKTNTLRLSFKIPYRVNFGQSVGLVGSGESLGNWDPKRFVLMKWTDGDCWTAEVSVVPGPALDLEYKYVVVNSDGQIGYWKPGSNYKVSVPVQPKFPKRVKVADAWDDSFKKVDVEELEAAASSAAAAAAAKNGKPPAAQAPQQPQAPPQAQATAAKPQAAAAPPPPEQPKPAAAGPSSNGTTASNGSGPSSNGVRSTTPPRATSPMSAPSTFAAATSIPLIHPSLLAEQVRLEDGVKNSLEDLQAQMDKHQHLREKTDDPAAPEVLVADRIVAAANNRVVAYNKALKAVQEYNRLPPTGPPADSSSQ